jgi:hypothetical protein
MYLCKLVEKKVLQSEIIDFFPTNAKRVVILDIKIARQRKTIEKIFSPEKKPVTRKKRDKRQKQQALVEPEPNPNVKNDLKQKKQTNKTIQEKPQSKQLNLLEILNSKNLS